ncbi:uncharacterized protein LOC125052272 [Pieris napi]|uniref:uncharacterized protein LOC125052272 n=1 Tax=Pieris napi TaxID=78633 RepID=UPI001FB94119|nr:uncharacterized protein LOC125052272 [Pieris napi]
MYKLLVVCAIYIVITEARPRWQYLPAVPGFVPVYIQNGDTPLEEINPELAEAFHALPAGRSAHRTVEAATDDADIPTVIDSRPYEKKLYEKKKKASFDIPKSVEQ